MGTWRRWRGGGLGVGVEVREGVVQVRETAASVAGAVVAVGLGLEELVECGGWD